MKARDWCDVCGNGQDMNKQGAAAAKAEAEKRRIGRREALQEAKEVLGRMEEGYIRIIKIE